METWVLKFLLPKILSQNVKTAERYGNSFRNDLAKDSMNVTECEDC
jgi:hypothetical protein